MLRRILYFIVIVFSWPVSAGLIELGVSGSGRLSRINEDNYQQSLSFTGSISYYFWELSALELSYTSGESLLVVQASETDIKQKIESSFQLAGVDLVITLAGKSSPLQPYVKVGGAYVRKDVVREVVGVGSDKLDTPEGVVPSAGLGLKLRLTDAFSIKMGVDAWSSVPQEEEAETIDYAGRVGISWLM